MASKKLLDGLNRAIAMDLRATIQYMWQHVMARLIEEWQTKRMEKNKPATVNRMLATLKHIFTKAVEWDMVEKTTWKRVRNVKLLPENNRRLRFLSKEECQQLIAVCFLLEAHSHYGPEHRNAEGRNSCAAMGEEH